MAHANPAERADLILGLRVLAAYLESNPEVPAPKSVDVYAFPPEDDCAVMRAGIDVVAGLLGVPARERAGGQHYTASRAFGPVGYHAVAICKTHYHNAGQG